MRNPKGITSSRSRAPTFVYRSYDVDGDNLDNTFAIESGEGDDEGNEGTDESQSDGLGSGSSDDVNADHIAESDEPDRTHLESTIPCVWWL